MVDTITPDNLDKLIQKTEEHLPPVKKFLSQEELLSKAKSHDILGINYTSIFLFGPPKTGKTWCYMPVIDETVKNGGHIFLISTDAGVTNTFKAYFKEQASKISESITFYMLSELEQMYSICKDIQSSVFQNTDKGVSKDLIIFDLISDYWDMGQSKFIDDASKGDPINYIINAATDKAKFGLFEGAKWQYIKKIEDYVIRQLVVPPICNIFGVAGEKEIEYEKIKSKKTIHKFDITGAKPAGSKGLPYYFNTFVYVNDTSNKRYFQVLGHRGSDVDGYVHHNYERNFYDKLKEVCEQNKS